MRIGKVVFENGAPFSLIAGPCALESFAIADQILTELSHITSRLGIGFVFKASFDKANRSSVKSLRGVGLEEGIEIFSVLRASGVPILTDVHEPQQCQQIAPYVDALQIPAYLCRQLDLLRAAAETGLPVVVKKGPFINTKAMEHISYNLLYFGCSNYLLVERGSTVGYDLWVDFRNITYAVLRGFPMAVDVTHTSAGVVSSNHNTVTLALASVANGVSVFLETHPNPKQASSDGERMLPLKEVEPLLRQLKLIDHAAAQERIDNGTPATEDEAVAIMHDLLE